MTLLPAVIGFALGVAMGWAALLVVTSVLRNGRRRTTRSRWRFE